MDFYDDLAPLYHLLFPDWDASIRRQGEQLDALVQATWPGHRRVLDVCCGIGTQALGLAGRGYAVTASDLSPQAVERARREAAQRDLAAIDFRVADMRAAHAVHGTGYDLVLSGDNSVPHLLTDEDIGTAFRQFHACLRPGGGCLISVRDYAQEPRGTNLLKPYAVRHEAGKRYVPFQVWDFDESGTHYDLAFFIVEDDPAAGRAITHRLRSRYYAVPTERLCALMREAGFTDVRRIDGAFYQPVLVGTRAAQAESAD